MLPKFLNCPIGRTGYLSESQLIVDFFLEIDSLILKSKGSLELQGIWHSTKIWKWKVRGICISCLKMCCKLIAMATKNPNMEIQIQGVELETQKQIRLIGQGRRDCSLGKE
jgi:hypothetical protein